MTVVFGDTDNLSFAVIAGTRLHALSDTTVSLQSYGSDSKSVLQEIPTSQLLQIMGEYVPG